MTVGSSVGGPTATGRPDDVLAVVDQLHERVRSAEDRAANLERALASNRRIGMAVGILMSRHQLTEDEAVAVLKGHSQHRNVKVRELAEAVIFTGTV